MQAWILRYGADTDGAAFAWEPIPGHLSAAQWVDGTGDVGDTCNVTLEGVDGAGVAKLLASRLSILLAPPADDGVDDLLCYGPYDVEPASVDGEARTWRLSGKIGSHFEATLADRDDEDEFYAALDTAINTTYAASQPWAGWATGAGAPSADDAEDYQVSAEFIHGQVVAQMVNAENLAGARQILAEWGLTATPYVESLTATGFDHRTRIEPIYQPREDGFTIPQPWTVRLGSLGAPASFALHPIWYNHLNLISDHLDAHPSVQWPDGANRDGDYRRRQISGIHRLFGENLSDNILITAGLLRPPVYLAPDNGPGLLKQREEVERWKLQNEAAMMTMTRRFASPYTDVARAFVTPLQLLTLGLHHLPLGVTEQVWLARQVNHAWDAEQGYRQTIKASLWQGAFWRTSGSAVKALTL